MTTRSLFLALLPLALATGPTTAGTLPDTNSDAVNATGACNGALPAFEGALRKRPLALRNEGTTSAFVSCSIQTDGFTNPGYTTGVLQVVNRNASSVALDCTMVMGAVAELGSAPTFYPRTIGVPAGSAGAIIWRASDYSLAIFDNWLNFNCNLPPGVEIALIGGTYRASEP